MTEEKHSFDLLASEPFKLQQSIDHIVETKPTFINKSFTYTGQQHTFNKEINNFHNYNQEFTVEHQGQSLRQYNITLIGDKVKPYNQCCRIATIITGIFFIFPFCFMCCDFWKKIVYPMYELQIKTYETIGEMIKQMNGILLNLRVIDNNFNKEKA